MKFYHKISVYTLPLKSVSPTFQNRSHRVLNPRQILAKTLVSVPPTFHFGATEISDQFTGILFSRIGISEFWELVSPRFRFYLGHPYRYHRDLYIGLTEKMKVATFCTSRCNRFFTPVSPSWTIMLWWFDFWRCLYIPLHHHSLAREALRTDPHLPHLIFWERDTYSCVEIKPFHSNHMNLDL